MRTVWLWPLCVLVGHLWDLDDYWHTSGGDPLRYRSRWHCGRCGKTTFDRPKGW